MTAERRGGRVRLAVSLGDPRGIGPEVAAAAAHALASEHDRPELIFVGPTGTHAEAAADEFVSVGDWRGSGEPAEAGRLAALAIEQACALTLAGSADALVTAPIHKPTLHAAGFAYPGHTEMLAALAGDVPVGMLMAAEQTAFGAPLRVVLATTHLPLGRVAETLDAAKLVEQGRLAAEGLRRGWAIESPRLALCALNPHASDGGLFGTEEADIYPAALRALRADGVEASGPVPADTVFVRALRGEFDAVVAPYHDVGMAAFKTAAFGRGVNVTLGLPFARTSPDHGTAFDIAGQGLADPGSMIEAIRLAARLALRLRASSAARA